MTISIAGLDKAEILAALYNSSKPQGMGFLAYDPAIMTTTEAQGHLDEQKALCEKHGCPSAGATFDYLKGRPIKVDLKGDEMSTRYYDRDAGEGAAKRVIDELRAKTAV